MNTLSKFKAWLVDWHKRWGRAGEVSSHRHYSLFGKILDWMLAPLLVIWLISILFLYYVATHIANQPYDQALSEKAQILAQLVRTESNALGTSFLASSSDFFEAPGQGQFYWQVRTVDGQNVRRNAEIPFIAELTHLEKDGAAVFYDAEISGQSVRVAALRIQLAHGEHLLVQFAQTLQQRSALTSRIVKGLLLPQFAMIPLVILLVWLGLTHGIAPLKKLKALIQNRRPMDLSPIDYAHAPEEVQPLILAFNGVMARLDENLSAQRRFINDAAHQMRTPLTGLKMQTELALMETDPQVQREALERIASSADRANHLINQLLVLARAESGSERIYSVRLVDLPKLAGEEIQAQYPLAHAKKIELAVEEPEWGLRVEGNPILLRELVKNLLNNAIKYTPIGGAITLRTLWDAQPVLEIEDTGVGIPEEEREKVFERFYRVLGGEEDGSGLGLPIVREIAQIHGATVSLLPGPQGKGTLARVVFPRGIQTFADAEPHSPGFFPLG